jgi:CTP synthase
MKAWEIFVKKVHNSKQVVKIAIVGKYFDTGDFVLSDAYLSVIEALKFSAYHLNLQPHIEWVNAKDFEVDKKKVSILKNFDCVLVPAALAKRGLKKNSGH